MSLRWRRRVDLALFLAGLLCCFAGLHNITDFNVYQYEWWRYYFENAVKFGIVPMPYTTYLIGGPILGVILALIGRHGVRLTSYGDARYASKRDIREFGLRAKDGLVLGETRGGKLISNLVRHVMVVAGTRSGKTQGIVIPTLFSFRGAAVVIDAKGELWESTAGYRSKFSDCYRLEWTAKETARYNMISLSVLPKEPDEIERRMAQIASVLMAKAGDRDDTYFDQDAKRLLNAILLLEVFDAKAEDRDAEIINVAHWCSEFSEEIIETAREERLTGLSIKLAEAAQRASDGGYPRTVTNDLTAFSEMNPRQRDGVVGTLESNMNAFKSGAVTQALSGCDFTARSLVEGDRPGTVYIVIQSEDREFVSPMTTALITNVVYSLVSRTSQEAAQSHPMLLLLEEFSSLKKTAAIPEAYDRGAGLGVMIMTVIQAFSQIRERYGRESLATFIQNTDFLAAFSQSDQESRELLANMVGKETRTRLSRSESGRGGDSYSEGLEGVPLILPQDWGAVPFGEHRLLVKQHHNRPVRSKTPFAYSDAQYKKWLKMPAPESVRPI